ncbi:MAG: restriction endonuclease subunit S [Planctomycetota bacterium]|nr:restriction endonuclease subunit S [Planctomycetota bacterium]
MPELDAQSLRRFKPYPAYKDSGVEWLGEIPAHWEVRRLKYVSSIENSGVYGAEPGEKDLDLPVCTTAHLNMDGRFLVHEMPVRGFSAREAAHYVGKPGDIFVVKSSGSNMHIISGKVGLVTEKDPHIVFSNFLLRIRPLRAFVLPEFLAYLLRSELTRERIQRMVATTTYPNIDVPEYVSSTLPIPPIDEQQAIAAFLDHETAKIDALVAKKERLIELLQEKRTALITRAVTRGLDPTVPMKDSGVEWLGQIPAHWEVRRVKRVFRVVNGSTPASSEPAYWDGSIPWVTPEDLGDLRSKLITATRRSLTEEGYQSCGTTLVPAGSLVLSTRAPIGHLAIAGVDLCTNQGCRSLVFRHSSSREFFYYGLLAARSKLESLGQGSTFRELATEDLENVKITVPPEPEQHAIAAFLDRETAKIDALIAKVREAIERLKEYRTALISAAVTGKIDVSEGGERKEEG